jgi:hypothetical protein
MNLLNMKIILKSLFLVLTVVLLGQCDRDEQNPQINIPDDNFLNALIERGVDTNGDSLISNAEAEAITYLNVSGKSIFDMTGIKAFINLDTLLCFDNHLTSLDLSKNSGLIFLGCWNNLLISLDFSNNTELEELGCNYNQLTSLDLSKNTALTELGCNYNQLNSLDVSDNNKLIYLNCLYNQLTTLDVSNNISLKVLQCSDNQLTSLDVSNNTSLKGLLIENMPSLNKVCVWIMPFPPEGVSVHSNGSPNVYFTTDCNK